MEYMEEKPWSWNDEIEHNRIDVMRHGTLYLW